jgi:hypothetical protein
MMENNLQEMAFNLREEMIALILFYREKGLTDLEIIEEVLSDVEAQIEFQFSDGE